MKKITKKLSTKYVKLHKCKLRQDAAVTSEESSGELWGETNTPANEETRETKTPRVTKIMEVMQRITFKEKARQQPSDRNIQPDGRDRLQPSEGSSHDRVDRLEGSSRNGQDLSYEGLTRKACDDHDLNQTEGSKDNRPEFDSRKDYHDWIEHVEGSSHHCFDRFQELNDYKRDDMEQDHISSGQSEGSVESNNDEIRLLKSSKKNKHKQKEDSKNHRKRKNRKFNDLSTDQQIECANGQGYDDEEEKDQCYEEDNIRINIERTEKSNYYMGYQPRGSPKIGNDFTEWSEGCWKNDGEWIDKFDEYWTDKIVFPRPK